MLQPSRTKFRFYHTQKVGGVAKGGTRLAFGAYGLKAVEAGHVTDRQLEAGRVAIIRAMGKGGKLWIRVQPNMPFTKKPLETRMGKGKGNIEGWYVLIKPGKVLFEVEGVGQPLAVSALRLAASKLPVLTKFIARADTL